jgi:acetolactate synthase-1/2/3 large subunit
MLSQVRSPKRLNHPYKYFKPYTTQTAFIQPDRVQRPSLDDKQFVGLTGGEIFHEMMLRQNVKVIFGYPGGAILPVYDAIYNSEYFDFVLPRHEQGAGN